MRLRNSIAHLDIQVSSNDENFLIDEIVFRNTEQDIEIARFQASELFGFLVYYSNLLISNLEKYRDSLPG